MLSIAQDFRKIHFLTHFCYFPQWMRCAIFQIKSDLLVIYQNINIFTQETWYPSILWKKICALHCKSFSKHSLFAALSLFLKFLFWNEGSLSGVLCKNIHLAYLSRIQYLFEILKTSLTVKTKGKCCKKWMFRKKVAMESSNVFSKWRRDLKSFV